jgi:hypothetical protein
MKALTMTNGVRWTLRLEGLLVLVAALYLYAHQSAPQAFGWGVFALFFLLPDVSFFGYLAGRQVGAVIYNIAHSYIGPVLCFLAGWLLGMPVFIATGLIWSAHIGFDRFLGYGLKYPSGFQDTHLGKIGRQTEQLTDKPETNSV